jgi:hypothetical protein
MFAACRNPASETIRSTSGGISDVPDHEYLDILALDKEWRHAYAKVPPASHITFDLSLPKPADDDPAPRRIYWDTATLPTGQKVFIVLARNVMRLVASLATATRMRVQGEVHFELSYDDAEGVSTTGMERLKKQLGGIAEAKGTFQTGIDGTVKDDPDSFSPDVGGDQ